VLKPAEFQEFELEEKTVLSHNTAMYVLPPCEE
jgi:cytochrome-b5 reductase